MFSRTLFVFVFVFVCIRGIAFRAVANNDIPDRSLLLFRSTRRSS